MADNISDAARREATHLEQVTHDLWQSRDAGDAYAWNGAMRKMCTEYIAWLEHNPGQKAGLRSALDKDHALIVLEDHQIGMARPLNAANTRADIMACTYSNSTGRIVETDAFPIRQPEKK
jgi:hypothetical protein